MIKIEETYHSVPHGEKPKNMTIFVEWPLTGKTERGMMVTVIGIYSIKNVLGVNKHFLRVVGMQVDN